VIRFLRKVKPVGAYHRNLLRFTATLSILGVLALGLAYSTRSAYADGPPRMWCHLTGLQILLSNPPWTRSRNWRICMSRSVKVTLAWQHIMRHWTISMLAI